MAALHPASFDWCAIELWKVINVGKTKCGGDANGIPPLEINSLDLDHFDFLETERSDP
jgi:hypothetical protein